MEFSLSQFNRGCRITPVWRISGRTPSSLASHSYIFNESRVGYLLGPESCEDWLAPRDIAATGDVEAVREAALEQWSLLSCREGYAAMGGELSSCASSMHVTRAALEPGRFQPRKCLETPPLVKPKIFAGPQRGVISRLLSLATNAVPPANTFNR